MANNVIGPAGRSQATSHPEAQAITGPSRNIPGSNVSVGRDARLHCDSMMCIDGLVKEQSDLDVIV